jgi:hypothetical protein
MIPLHEEGKSFCSSLEQSQDMAVVHDHVEDPRSWIIWETVLGILFCFYDLFTDPCSALAYTGTEWSPQEVNVLAHLLGILKTRGSPGLQGSLEPHLCCIAGLWESTKELGHKKIPKPLKG